MQLRSCVWQMRNSAAQPVVWVQHTEPSVPRLPWDTQPQQTALDPDPATGGLRVLPTHSLDQQVGPQGAPGQVGQRSSADRAWAAFLCSPACSGKELSTEQFQACLKSPLKKSLPLPAFKTPSEQTCCPTCLMSWLLHLTQGSFTFQWSSSQHSKGMDSSAPLGQRIHPPQPARSAHPRHTVAHKELTVNVQGSGSVWAGLKR